MTKILMLAAILLCLPFTASRAQYLPKKKYTAYKIETPPSINGELDDEAWQTGKWEGDFTQFEPYADRPPSQPTEFKIAFDNMNLYVAFRAIDSAPDSITNRMSRRDNGDGDMVFIVFDSYHDLRTGFVFGVSSAGVRFDMTWANDGQIEDPSWDPIWQARAKIHDWGWAAEMKIPFTQLRFKKNSDEVWGMDVARQIFRHNEMSLWHPIPRDASGMVHTLGEMDGLEEIEPRRQLDLTPYGVTSLNTYEPEVGNPFMKGTNFKYNVGLDGKVGVTNNLTLDFTVNPDFGQVEADPSEVNLTAYETYFQEKRPFFIEGSSITSFNVGLGDGDVGNDNLFYSRRIGRIPQGYPSNIDNESDEYAYVPRFTNIIAATKLTGKTENGLSVGIIEALTADMKADIDSAGITRKETVEPLTNYALARVQKDFNKGRSIIGGMVTNTIRRLDGTNMQDLHKNATTGGIDFTQYFGEMKYRLNAAFYLSNVQGSEEAISNTQLSSARYFQRPDADYLEYDDTRTSLTGYGGKFELGRIGGHWNWIFMSILKSPGLEFNDVGFMRQADQALSVLWTGYNFTEPFSIFRSLRLSNDVYVVNDFGGNLLGFGYEANININFKNMWNGGLGGGYSFRQRSNTMLRGGASMLTPNDLRFNARISTDERKAVSVGIFTNFNRGADEYMKSDNLGLSMTVRPINTLSISLSPSYSKRLSDFQYIARRSYLGDQRYLFGTIDQKVLSMSLRINYNITPDLTIQYWGQPFTASGSYSEFKKITDPNGAELKDRYHVFEGQEISFDGDRYSIDDNSDGTPDYNFGNPNFNVNEWLSNLVVRWEFLPGSTAYLVWSQTRNYYSDMSSAELWENMDKLFTGQKANNVFMVKFSYRFGLR